MAAESTQYHPGMPRRHPKRTQPHESVSLRRDPQRMAFSHKDSQSTSNTSSLLRTKASSGETSNADHWFENKNENVLEQQSSFADNDPPFYHDNSPPYGYPPLTLPLRPSLLQLQESGSSSEEYRSVIDDLTIENKRLKKKIRKLEGSHKSQLDSDKLFEVKVHGLPAEKKRELEETLRKFAQSLNQSPVSAVNASSSGLSAPRRGAFLKPSSTLSSTRVADSGYGSLTNTGKPSSPRSGSGNGNGNGNGTGAGAGAEERLEASANRNRSIHSYLSDIPIGLMPRRPTAMTEKSKKKLVVRRLESIFCGRNAIPGFHQQPLQQQEVSRSAAKADKSALEAQGQETVGEGAREALIMATETEDPMDFVQGLDLDKSRMFDNHSDDDVKVDHRDFAYPESSPVEQRPTRPLDLDPYRAQIPADNVQYIRHLGFAVADADVKRSEMDDEGWIYLNLLINMAQLHTFNVTPDFVRKAVGDFSSKLELSKDSRKIRWRGRGSSQGSSSLSNSGTSDGSPASQSAELTEGRKRPRATTSAVHDPSLPVEPARKKRSVSHDPDDKFAYKPLFPPKEEEDSDNEVSIASSVSSTSSFEQAGQSSGFTSTVKLMRATSISKRRDDGPIIFYNQAGFCADLSGDASLSRKATKMLDYQPFTSRAIGARSKYTPSAAGSARPSRRPLLTASWEQANGYSSDSTATELELPRASPKHVTFAEPEEPYPFHVSGIGGVYPADNLAITVLRQHTVDPSAPPPKPISSSKLHNVLPETKHTRNSREIVLSTRYIKYAPSALPPPSYALNGGDTDSEHESDIMSVDSESDSDDEATTRRPSNVLIAGPAGKGLMSRLSASINSNAESASDEYSDDDSAIYNGPEDSTVDFLAAARAVDPETIRVMEREYDAEVADRLAEEIPAGSSAATAGGGSGFNSPADWRFDDEMNDAYDEQGEERSIMS